MSKRALQSLKLLHGSMALLSVLLRYYLGLSIMLDGRIVGLLALRSKRIREVLGVSRTLDITQMIHGFPQINLSLLSVQLWVDVTEGRVNHILRSLRKLLIQSQCVVASVES